MDKNIIDESKRLADLRKTVREFLYEIESVPMRAIDCDQDKVDKLREKLIAMSGWRGPKA